MDDRRMFRYVVPVDGQPHEFGLSHSPVAVAAVSGELEDVVEFWAESTQGAPEVKRAFQVFATGLLLPGDARWVGSCPRIPGALVWHLYEVKLPGWVPLLEGLN